MVEIIVSLTEILVIIAPFVMLLGMLLGVIEKKWFLFKSSLVFLGIAGVLGILVRLLT